MTVAVNALETSFSRVFLSRGFFLTYELRLRCIFFAINLPVYDNGIMDKDSRVTSHPDHNVSEQLRVQEISGQKNMRDRVINYRQGISMLTGN